MFSNIFDALNKVLRPRHLKNMERLFLMISTVIYISLGISNRIKKNRPFFSPSFSKIEGFVIYHCIKLRCMFELTNLGGVLMFSAIQ